MRPQNRNIAQKLINFTFHVSLFFTSSQSFAFDLPTACSFYKPTLAPASFAAGTPFAGCAEFSAVLGRNRCKKIKGVCPACVRYPGDHLQMWLPDYFIEVTKHIGTSVFTSLPTGALLKVQLEQARAWQDSTTGVKSVKPFSSGSHSPSGASSFWHARILTLPYGAQINTFSPLKSSEGLGFPQCYLAISEFFNPQWNLNLADAPFALAWMPIGSIVCSNPAAIPSAELMSKASAGIGSASSGMASTGALSSFQCALPVSAKEGYVKNILPSSDAVSPLRKNPYESLCMGSWGNLLPRTGWISTDDPFMSAAIAAYKFQSLAGDFNLNSALKIRSSDKWQFVYPPRLPNTCFKPGSSLQLVGTADDAVSRSKAEFGSNTGLKDHTYIIAVWRKRESCEEPLQYINGWNTSHQAHLQKNATLCAGMGGL